MRAGRAASGMLLAAGICVAAVLCSIGVTQETTTAVAESGGATPTITVIRPNGGEHAQHGAFERIRWSWTGNPGPNVKIALYKGGAWDGMITSSTPNDGWFTCPVPCSVVPASDYKVKISSLSDPSVCDFSDGNFSVTSFRLTAPGCGVSWKRGTTHSISWISKCSPGPNVKLALYKGGVWVNMIASSTPNDGWYSWAIPANTTAGSDYKVRVTSLSNAADWADSCAFSITQ